MPLRKVIIWVETGEEYRSYLSDKIAIWTQSRNSVIVSNFIVVLYFKAKEVASSSLKLPLKNLKYFFFFSGIL